MTDRIRLQKEVRGSKEEEARELLCSDESRKWRWQRWQGAKVKLPTLLDLTQETQTQVETRLDPKYARLGWRFALAKGALTEATWASFEFANLPPREHQLLLLGRLVLVTAAALEPFHACEMRKRDHCAPPPDTEVWSARGLSGYVTDTYGHLAKQEELMAKRPELRKNFAARCFATLACQLSGTAALVVEELGADALGLDVELKDWLTRAHFVRSRRCPESEDEDWQDAQEDIEDDGATADRSIAPPHRLSKAQAKALAIVRTVLAQNTSSKPQALQKTREIAAALRHLKLPPVVESKPSQDKTSGSKPSQEKTSGSKQDQAKTSGSKTSQGNNSGSKPSLEKTSCSKPSQDNTSRSKSRDSKASHSSGSSSRALDASSSKHLDEWGRFSTPKGFEAYLTALRDCLELSDLRPTAQRDLTFLSLARQTLPQGLGSSEAPDEATKGTKVEKRAAQGPPASVRDASKASSSKPSGSASSKTAAKGATLLRPKDCRNSENKTAPSEASGEATKLPTKASKEKETAGAPPKEAKMVKRGAKEPQARAGDAAKPSLSSPAGKKSSARATSSRLPLSDSEDEVARLVDGWRPRVATAKATKGGKTLTQKSAKTQGGHSDAAPKPAVKLAPVKPTPQPKAKSIAKPAQPATCKPDIAISKSSKPSQPDIATSKPSKPSQPDSLAPKQWREALSRRLAPLVSLTPQLLGHSSVQTVDSSQLGTSHKHLPSTSLGAAQAYKPQALESEWVQQDAAGARPTRQLHSSLGTASHMDGKSKSRLRISHRVDLSSASSGAAPSLGTGGWESRKSAGRIHEELDVKTVPFHSSLPKKTKNFRPLPESNRALRDSEEVPFHSSYASQRRRLERLAQRLRRQRLCWEAACG